MGKINIKAEYPCGYKQEIFMQTFFGEMNVDSKNYKGCPLHGMKCKKDTGN